MQMHLISQLSAILGFVCVTVMSLFLSIEIQNSENIILEDTHRIQAQLLENMGPILQKNMWDFNTDDIKPTVEGFFKNKETMKFEIFDEKGNAFEGTQRKNTLPSNLENADQNTLEPVTKEQVIINKIQGSMKTKGLRNILFEDLDFTVKRVGILLFKPSKEKNSKENQKVIGYARLTYNTEEAVKRAQDLRFRAFAWSSIICGSVLISALAFLVIEILRPLKKLRQASKSLTNGEYLTIPGRIPRNEIGHLMANFNKMVSNRELKNRLQMILIEDSATFFTSKSLLNIYLQIQNIYSVLLNRKLDIQFYVLGDYISNGQLNEFYFIEQNGTPRKATGVYDINRIYDHLHKQVIKQAKDNKNIASIEFSIDGVNLLEDELWALEKLSPSILGALSLVKPVRA